ncbi:hypothetical protein Mesil_1316 [Allomeiothermus silvanus DSM 9946]|uniref:Uncharacterized protein n=1 Tax=Allomeiothermus silvanus (strain ATCC 700542 / DSM 9946 / NBRC 106475 / NCIMB 13440 / VI-R2) TaxID=526227 RepID=D7BEG7_ALLS1|nr:hypothetical protein [Allomeiothermus silvanus]ADH63210.1 hypothetical protein Mesil_1316 [Allomeiothermus silvanus DSM 9946]
MNSQLGYVLGGIFVLLGLYVWFAGPHSLLWGIVLIVLGAYFAYSLRLKRKAG